MGLTVQPMEYGSKIVGSVFTFEDAGDVLEWHTHTYDDQHITIVGRGEFRLEVRDEVPRTISAGDLIDTWPGICHQFTALTADARLFSICKEELRAE